MKELKFWGRDAFVFVTYNPICEDRGYDAFKDVLREVIDNDEWDDRYSLLDHS